MNFRYVATGILRRHIPETLLFAAMKLRGGGNRAETAPGVCLDEWRERLAKDGVSLEGKQVLEIGSGRYALLALHMVAAGARRVTLIDFYAVPTDEPHHRALIDRECATLGLDVADALARIEVISGDFLTYAPPAPEGRVDLVFSAAVLEHVRDPALVLERCWEWLRPGGVTYHVVDLRDHNARFRYPFEMLTFSDHDWARWFDLPGGFHLNRWRSPDYLRAIQNACFMDAGYDVLLEDQAGVREVLPRLDSRWRPVPEAVLSILVICLYGHKPSSAVDT